ncbi:MAG TPA: methyl-accepting chemotaxis protein [Trinickia sp.]|jgi:methyl-accepting chemotaxis protein-1 (serine sensor receptor)|uniref:methyl-accepting chemotaxis protein n=1 Tax=Trinickia sp. TaxID=2571163 RepID=UPI002B99AB53|nr:methyl-accepting chemotaxis protein [Trinickia sp.]HTI17290.1 methyl-accepting chemotaxis protein [Trinickia sp.]
MFSALSINGRLGLTMSLLSALLIGVGLVGLIGMHNSNEANRQVYAVQLVKTLDISDMVVNVGRERTSLDRAAIAPGSADAKLMYSRTDDVRITATKAWNHYLQLPHDAEEGRLADATNDLLKQTHDEIAKFQTTIQQADHDQIAAQAIVVGTIYTHMQGAADALKSYQLGVAKQGYEEAGRNYNLFFAGSIIAIGVGVLAALWSWVALRRAILGPVRQALQHFSEISGGDLRHRIEIASSDEMGRLLEGLSSMQQSLTRTVSSVRTASDAIAGASREIAAGNADLSARTESQAASLQETAASAEQLTGTVKQNADSAREASALATNASDIARQGHEVVSRVIGTMSEISQRSTKISEIIALIDGIAFQTNILALNAAVEAARAGEQGRGFAVVAGEVRALAQRSSSAAKDIKALIVDSVDRIGTGSAQVEEAGRTMGQIIDAVTRVNSIMGEISAASQEQTQGITQVAQAVNQMDQVTQQNAALVEEASAAAQSLFEQARALEQTAALFKLPASDRFVQPVPIAASTIAVSANAEPFLA